ncbi:MAG: hypothetical protein HY901_30765 [Deltaproteobacteria bacterium]|nr:hypothetical protein [Deltaproteobacteria bacterium]
MANPAQVILSTLDRHLKGPTSLRLMGGAALILGYQLDRATEDADLLIEQAELEALVENAEFGEALEATNRELEPQGLYLSHVWGPEQQILTPEWKQSCRPIAKDAAWKWIDVSVLGPLDLLVGKLARADEEDLEDIRFLIAHESLAPTEVRKALDRAVVPEILADAFAASRPKIDRLLGAK